MNAHILIIPFDMKFTYILFLKVSVFLPTGALSSTRPCELLLSGLWCWHLGLVQRVVVGLAPPTSLLPSLPSLWESRSHMSSQDLKKECGGTSRSFRRNKGKRLRDGLSPDIFKAKTPGASYNPYVGEK